MHKHTILVAFLLFALGACRAEQVPFMPAPVVAGDYLDVSDSIRVARALNTAPDRQPVQWFNDETDYQYSLMVFESQSPVERAFTLLSLDRDGEAEVLSLIGRKTGTGTWAIHADKPPTYVGRAERMNLTPSPIPAGSTSSGIEFQGFPILTDKENQ